MQEEPIASTLRRGGGEEVGRDVKSSGTFGTFGTFGMFGMFGTSSQLFSPYSVCVNITAKNASNL